MAVYDMQCQKCNIGLEVRCPMNERESQLCVACGDTLTPMFSPPTQIVIPRAFSMAFSDLYGTSSEKDYLKENPNMERINQSTFVSAKDKRRREREKIIREGQDVERALIAQGKFKKYEVEAGSMTSDV